MDATLHTRKLQHEKYEKPFILNRDILIIWQQWGLPDGFLIGWCVSMGHHELLQTQELFYETFLLLLDALFQIPNKVSYQCVTCISTKLLYTVPIEILRLSIFLS